MKWRNIWKLSNFLEVKSKTTRQVSSLKEALERANESIDTIQLIEKDKMAIKAIKSILKKVFEKIPPKVM
ncbi:hypothetical protein [Priestia megaterium]|uniref:hypothetical protein n=1 Tax=Priestia megaterium TaxID=1404 RepID=UPI002E23C3FB|nr:hypothetical protein [Priestia megaterium]